MIRDGIFPSLGGAIGIYIPLKYSRRSGFPDGLGSGNILLMQSSGMKHFMLGGTKVVMPHIV